MTAAQIIGSYKQTARVANLRVASWMNLLLIASHGTRGCPALSLQIKGHRHKGGTSYHTLHAWQAKGLVKLDQRTPRNRPVLWVTITPAACAMLKITVLPFRSPSHPPL